MEADWEFEIGGGAPVIEAYWSGFVDLRAHPERVSELSECGELRALADALVRLNGKDSPVWTSKADVFTPEHFDSDEMDASPEDAVDSIGCYIDVLPRGDQIWDVALKAERDCRRICAELRGESLRCCRVDVVVRRAVVADVDGLGATVYFTACGSTSADAKERLGECLTVFARVVSSRPRS